MTFVLVPRGRARVWLRAGFVAALVLVVLAELYLAGDYLSAAVYAVLLAICMADVAFRWLVPEDDQVIDEGMAMVRTFWDIGVAHRDIKPANLLVKDGHLQLVDVSGLEVRPSPWRQAVDLSNMLLCPTLRSDPERVYARATRVFTPDDIGEAFASAVGLTIPTELQAKLKADGRPLLNRFRQLAPAHAPVSIQRWSTQRLLLTAAAALGALLLTGLFADSLRAGFG
jgi:hypothetical protein